MVNGYPNKTMEQLTLANRNNNPGNLKDPKTGSFRTFNSPQEGFAELMNDLEIKKSGKSKTGLRPDSTLADFASVYAPSSDKNDPAQYTANLANFMGVRPDARLHELDTGKWAEAIAKAEGYKGTYSNSKQQTQPVQEKKFADKNRTEILNEDLNRRGEQFKTGIESLIGGKEKTGQTRASGLLQTVGAGAGALGDVTSAGLRLIPGVKQLEGLIGTGVENLAKTEIGQSVVNSMKEFADEHPELSKDLEAGFNIVTAIPILKGLGVAKNLAFDTASMALKNKAEKTFTDEVSRIVSKSARGSEFISRNPEAISTLVKERIIPEIKDGTFNTISNRQAVRDEVKTINSQVKNLLKNDTTTRVADENLSIINNVLNGYTDRLGRKIEGFAQSKLTPDKIVDIAEELTPGKAKLWDKFRKGDISLAEINELRSELDSAVSSVYSKMNVPSFNKDVGATLSGAMRDFVQTFKPETQTLFQRMSSLYDVDNVLKYLSGKNVKPASIFGTIQNITKDVPVGSFIGKKIGSQGPEITTGILKRTGKNAQKTTKEQLKKLPGLLSGFLNK